MKKQTGDGLSEEISLCCVLLLFTFGGYFIGRSMVVDSYGMTKIFGGWTWIIYGVIFLGLFGYAADLIWNFWVIDERLEKCLVEQPIRKRKVKK